MKLTIKPNWTGSRYATMILTNPPQDKEQRKQALHEARIFTKMYGYVPTGHIWN